MLDKHILNLICDTAVENGWGIVIEVSTSFLPLPEKIINPFENVKVKQEYYESAYDDELRLKNNPEIQITSIGYHKD